MYVRKPNAAAKNGRHKKKAGQRALTNLFGTLRTTARGGYLQARRYNAAILKSAG